MPKYPFLEFVLSIGTWDTAEEAYADTDCDTGLSIPAGVGREILAEPDVTLVRLPGGEMREVPSWMGTVEICGRQFRTEVVALGNRYLLGREVLDHVEICFEYGQRVRIRFRDGGTWASDE